MQPRESVGRCVIVVLSWSTWLAAPGALDAGVPRDVEHLPSAGSERSVALPADPGLAAQIDRWVHELSSADFRVRRDAERQLVEQGLSALDAVVRGVESAERETSLRCLEVLSRLSDSADPELRRQVVAVLQRLAQSSDASIATRAERLTDHPALVTDVPARTAALRNVPARIQFVQQAPLPFNENGERRFVMETNGRQIRITEKRDEEILVRVTETVNGRRSITEVSATSAADLRRKDINAYLLYRQHILQGGAAAIVNLQVQPRIAAKSRVRVTVTNGERRITAIDGDTTIDILDSQAGDISITVTEAGNPPRVSEFSVADREELQSAHPDAAAIYDRYASKDRLFQWRTGGGAPLFPPEESKAPGGDRKRGG